MADQTGAGGLLTSSRLAGLSIIACAILLIAILYLLAGLLGGTGIVNEFGLPILAIAGAVLILGAMALISLSFALFGLCDKNQALGLPEGSIRAVIALMLIVLFAILSIYLYGSMAAPRLATAANLSLADRERFVANLPPNHLLGVSEQAPGGPYTIYFRNERNLASDDMAKQLMVLIGTLVTSLVSFYFGSRATAATAEAVTTAATARLAAAESGAPPSLQGVTPDTLKKGTDPVQVEIRGQNLALAQAVKLVSGATEIAAFDVVSSATLIRCKVAVDKAPALASWDVVASDSKGRTATLPQALSIAEAD